MPHEQPARGRPARTDFERALAARFRPPAADMDAVLGIGIDHGPLLAVLAVAGGELRFAPPEAPEATFYFDSAQTALAVLGGKADPMAAFMAGRFRSDGNLPLAFVLLGLFRPDYAPLPPP